MEVSLACGYLYFPLQSDLLSLVRSVTVAVASYSLETSSRRWRNIIIYSALHVVCVRRNTIELIPLEAYTLIHTHSPSHTPLSVNPQPSRSPRL